MVDKTGIYLTDNGYEQCYIKDLVEIYGDSYYIIINNEGKELTIKKWKVIEQ